jgi:hypothetical protein
VWSDGTLTSVVPGTTAMLRRGQDGSRTNGTSQDKRVASVNVPPVAGSVRSHERSPMGR